MPRPCRFSLDQLRLCDDSKEKPMLRQQLLLHTTIGPYSMQLQQE